MDRPDWLREQTEALGLGYVANGSGSASPLTVAMGGGVTAGVSPSLADRIAKTTQSLQSELDDGDDGDGGGSIFGKVLGAVAEPLNMLGTIGRTPVSFVDELMDDDGFQFQEFAEQATNPEFGFGTFLHDKGLSTGNQWIDRGLGFVGDVALDPTTYLTAGATKAAGASGRITQALRAAELGLGDDVARRIAREGVSFLDEAQRAQLGLRSSALHFAGRPVAGTEGLGRSLGRGLSHVRRAVGDSRLGTPLSELRTPEHLRGAYESLLRGRGDVGVRQALAAIAGDNAAQALAGRTKAEFQSVLSQMDKRLSKAPIDREGLFHAVESGVQDEATNAIRGIRRDLLNRVRAAGGEIGDVGADQLPHLWNTKAYERVFGRDDLAGVLDASGQAVDTTKGRKIGPGSVLRNKETGAEVVIRDGTAAEINAAVKQLFPDLKVAAIETDPIKALSKNVNDIANRLGELSRFNKYVDMGVAERLSDDAAADMSDFARFNENLPEDQITGSLLQENAALAREVEAAFDEDVFADAAKQGWFGERAAERVREGWQRIDDGLTSQGIVAPPEMRKAFQRVDTGLRDGTWQKLFDGFNKVFKTYATLSPGFHVRNAMSATFMNMADGVSVRNSLDGGRMFMEFRKDPQTWLKNASTEERQALDAVFASGAGGAWEAAETGLSGVERVWGAVGNNPLTRASRRAGEVVEGVVRAGAALDAIRKGLSFDEAVQRVTRLHFNYGNVSKLDRSMKMVIPFWTFMSRNLPLQLQQMAMRPAAYSIEANLRDNLDQFPDMEMSPWQAARNPFTVGLPGTDLNAQIAPDLAHYGLGDTVPTSWSDVLGQLSPLLQMPVQGFANRDLFTGIEYEDQGAKWRDQLRDLFPVLGNAGRLGAPVVSEDFQRRRAWESAIRMLGAPVTFVDDEGGRL